MKKALSVFLSLVMIFSFVLPAFAVGYSRYRGPVPVVIITGDGEDIYDTEGNVVLVGGNFFGMMSKGRVSDDDSSVLEAARNILMPLLMEGVLFDKWDNYYEAVYNEISDLFAAGIPDENGNPKNGTDISPERRAENALSVTTDRAVRGTYAFDDYHFWYDWRLDPIQIADELNEFIEGVKSATGHDKVCIVTRCIASSVLLAYVANYGTGSIYGVGIDGSATAGSEFLSGALSGDFGVDGNAIARFIEDGRAYDRFNVDPFVESTLDLLENSGALNKMTDAARKLLYLKIEKGVISAVARASYMTMLSYWALVSEDKYETAKEYVFGPEGDPKRTEYAGLIEKLDNYDVTVRRHIPELLKSITDAGANICIVSKYGTQIVPIVKDADYVGDEFASVTSSSFGATASKLYNTLSDEYIAERTAAGYGEYISPDRQIDASTCLFPDSTYFVKGPRHAEWSLVENDVIMRTIEADRQLKVGDMEYSRFIISHNETNTWEVMTEENCNTEHWSSTSAEAEPATKHERLASFLKALFAWLKGLFDKLAELFKKQG